ncbi:hypothetical protein AAFF_G00055720 [Aldrovandia affinis]|uniref:Uncharacterized protein n=1 Tax=Aldrovandia affinis TaxID=143900 RepID=A0AAD7S0V0_9TELE|nr:hypothetical protein AAFF_G00055720 [Aldrovandia affinis]
MVFVSHETGICYKHHSRIVEKRFVFIWPLFHSLALTKRLVTSPGRAPGLPWGDSSHRGGTRGAIGRIEWHRGTFGDGLLLFLPATEALDDSPPR